MPFALCLLISNCKQRAGRSNLPAEGQKGGWQRPPAAHGPIREAAPWGGGCLPWGGSLGVRDLSLWAQGGGQGARGWHPKWVGNGRKSVTEGESRWHCDFRLCCWVMQRGRAAGRGGRAPRCYHLPWSVWRRRETRLRSRVAAGLTQPGGDLNPGPSGWRPRPHWAPRGRRAGRPRLGSSAPRPAPDSAQDPSLHLPLVPC